MKLVIAEKPSVAQAIAKVIGANERKDGYVVGNGYIVSWCVGHLVELAEPQEYDEKYQKWRKEDLPIIPDMWKYQVTSSTKSQFKILSDLMKRDDVESLVEATDAGREGELIFRLVYNQAKCEKPFERLWISSMEDEAIVDGFKNLKLGKDYDALYEAALCRERADWIVGINATRFFSTLYGQTLNVGRVMTPTLALAVEREAAIKAFRPEVFYTVLLKADGLVLASNRIASEEEAKSLVSVCKNEGRVIITKSEKTEKKEKSPALFDLTTLQREANKKLGFTAQQTLDYTQSLYEKKLVTYPRTDSRYLTDDMEVTIPGLLDKISDACDIHATDTIDTKKVVNSKKVTDHHAIIPTGNIATANLSELPSGEKEILKLIATRFAESVSSPCVFFETVVEATCGDNVFKSKGKQVIDLGWKAISKFKSEEDSDTDESCISINLNSGQEVSVFDYEIKQGKTTAPKSFTEDTLLSAMEKAGAEDIPDEAERKGLGTPATRAGIIEKLVRIGFIERKGDKKTKYLIPTEKGAALITVIPEEIQSASMTAEWEQKLLEVERRSFDSDEFMIEIDEMIKHLIESYELIPDAKVLMKPTDEAIGKCPCCDSNVIERPKGYFCSNKECNFALWKNNSFLESISKKMTKQIAEQLLSNGSVKLKDCKSKKTGKSFNCTLKMYITEDLKTQFELEFSPKNKNKEAR
ncbi:DNA topoisomerase-3 [Lachnospiraceae bacterium C7]|nr:DNA topoisomerase-3 [Lachnospiraceae bacterium C7]